MANNESGKSVDYFELRRRHQEYKRSTGKEPEDGGAPAPRPARAEDAPFMRPAPPAEDVYEDDLHAKNAADDEAAEDAVEDEPDDSGANPFQSFILTFNRIRDRLAARRGGHAREVLDDSDDGYDDEEPQEERRGPFRFLKKREEEPEEDEPEEDEPEEDEREENEPEAPGEDFQDAKEAPRAAAAPFAQDAPEVPDMPEVLDMPEEELIPEGEAIPIPRAKDAEPYDEDDEDEDDEAPRGGGFKRFLNLFVVREDRVEDEPIGEDDYEIGEPESQPEARKEEFDDSLFARKSEQGASEEEQESMGEQENNKDNMTNLMADGLEDGTLSRRERRLMRERQEALARAAEPEAPKEATIDEPTREYKPVSRPQAQEVAEPPKAAQSLFGEDEQPRRKPARDEDEDEPKSRKRAKREEYDDEDDDYDEPKPRKKGRRDEDDDEDEDDDYDEPKSRKKARRDEDEDDDYDEPKPRRRARRDEYDEDDEPRRGRRYEADQDDDYDDYDDYDDAPSFGHYVLGFLKVLIAVVLVVAVALFGLYFADQAVPGGVGAYAWIREKAPVIDKILPPGEDDSADAGDMLDTSTTSPDESQAPDATDAGTVG